MPDEPLLARWLEDELEGAELAHVDAWVADRAEWPAWREEIRAWKQLVQRALPDEVAPPADEFFAARIAAAVREHGGRGVAAGAPAGGRGVGWGWRWWRPLAAAAGMAVCFWAGTQIGGPEAPAGQLAQGTQGGQGLVGKAKVPAATAVYTPEQGVKARVFDEAGAEALVIVLEGVAAIPDSFEVPGRATGAADGQTEGRADAGWISRRDDW